MSRFDGFFLPAVLLAASTALLPSAIAQAPLPNESGHFVITESGKALGESQFTIAPLPGGDTLTSSGSMKADKFSYSFNSTATVDAQGNLVRDQLTGSVHGAKASGNNIRFDTSSDPTGRSFSMHVDADGKQTTNQVDRHRNTVLVPDLDPAAYTLMVHIALAQPRTAWVLIPKQNGILVPADYSRLADLNGTLNGQSITVKHSVVAMSMRNSIVVELFYTAHGRLLEADLNAQNIHVTRDGFRLLNRPRPVAPPAGAPPTAQGQGQPGQAPGGQQPMPPQPPQ